MIIRWSHKLEPEVFVVRVVLATNSEMRCVECYRKAGTTTTSHNAIDNDNYDEYNDNYDEYNYNDNYDEDNDNYDEDNDNYIGWGHAEYTCRSQPVTLVETVYKNIQNEDHIKTIFFFADGRRPWWHRSWRRR